MSSKQPLSARFAKAIAVIAIAYTASFFLLNPAAAGDQHEWTGHGLRFLHGEGVPADVDRAVVYLCAAARHGSGEAAFELAWLYFHGRDVQRDDALAAGWFQQAQQKGQLVPPRVAEMLEAVKPAKRRCVASHGEDLQIDDRRRARLAVTIYDLAPQFELDPALVLEVVRAESNFNPRARSHKGALGLMQLIPATARRFGVEDPLEPMQNLKGGMAYLRWLHERFDGDLALTLAGYNAGEHAVDRYGGVPPYAETREYVKRILRRYGAESFG